MSSVRVSEIGSYFELPFATVSPIAPSFGLKIWDVELARLSSESLLEFKNLLYRNKFLVVKGVKWTTDQYVQFANRLGRTVRFVEENYRHPDHPEIFVVSNVKPPAGQKKVGMERVGYYWHSDSSFLPEPLPITMLHAQRVPKDQGQTAFIDMQQVYARLPLSLKKQVDHRWAWHEGKWRYLITENDLGMSLQDLLDRDESQWPAPLHPMVVVHPVTGERALYITEGITKRIHGVGAELSDSILASLNDLAWNDSSKYVHQWETGDFVIWDNRSLVHRAYPAAPGQDRLMYRIGVSDGDFFGRQSGNLS